MEPGHEGNVGKACETEITVLEYARYQVNTTPSAFDCVSKHIAHYALSIFMMFAM